MHEWRENVTLGANFEGGLGAPLLVLVLVLVLASHAVAVWNADKSPCMASKSSATWEQ